MSNRLSIQEILAESERVAGRYSWEGTFANYLRLVTDNPGISRLSHKLIYDAIVGAGVEESPASEPVYKLFDDEIFGLEDELGRMVQYFAAAANRLEIRKRILLLLGPPASGKSTIVSLLKRTIENYTRSDSGAVFAIKGCPMQEEPLHLIPHDMRPQLMEEFGIADRRRLGGARTVEADRGLFADFLHQHFGRTQETQRSSALDLFQKVYGQAIGTGPVMDYIRQTGIDAMRGADVLKQAPARYSSTVEYADNSIAQSLKGAAQVHLADLGARVLYTQHGGYDVHANEVPSMQLLWTELSGALSDFFADLREHDASENVMALVFTEFGRRVRDNGNGTDHGSGGGSFLIGDRVVGGMYAEYPSLAPEKHLEGDLQFNYDYRGLYSSILEQWLELDPVPIVNGNYEQIHPFQN